MKKGRSTCFVILITVLMSGGATAQTESEGAGETEETPSVPNDESVSESATTDGTNEDEPAAESHGDAGLVVEIAPEILENEPLPDEQENSAEETTPVETRHFPSKLRLGHPARVEFTFSGEYSLRIIGQSDIRISEVPTDREDPEENILGPVTDDNDPNELGQNFYLLHWLRIRPQLAIRGQVRLIGQMDLLYGHIAGDDTQYVDFARDTRSHQQGVSAEGVRPRHLYLEWRSPVGLFRLGQMGSYWGMGLLANDGDHTENYLFGDHEYGDIVERFVYFTKPFYRLTQNPIRELAVFLGGDIVFDDGIANLVKGDLAWQIIGGLLWQLDRNRALGLYVTYRNQTYDDGDYLKVTALDLYAKWNLRMAHLIEGYLETEIVGLLGSTNAAPNLNYTDLDVRQFAFAARLGVRLQRLNLDIRVEGGYTSGDANANDDRINRFTGDTDYRVGLILFHELLAWSTARAATIAGHEELVGVPQEGTELLPTNGGVAGSAYVYPSLTWSPLRWLDIQFAVLIAQATADVVSPFATKESGEPSNFRGGTALRRDLGIELDLGVEARWNLDWVQFRFGVEGAYCIPGRAFDDEEGNRHADIGLVRGRFQFDW